MRDQLWNIYLRAFGWREMALCEEASGARLTKQGKKGPKSSGHMMVLINTIVRTLAHLFDKM